MPGGEGRVDEQIDRAELRLGLVEEAPDVLLAPHVAGQARTAGALVLELRERRRQCRFVHLDGRHRGAGAGQGEAGRPADSAARTRHEGHAAVEAEGIGDGVARHRGGMLGTSVPARKAQCHTRAALGYTRPASSDERALGEDALRSVRPGRPP